jgi:hypothetical protein
MFKTFFSGGKCFFCNKSVELYKDKIGKTKQNETQIEQYSNDEIGIVYNCCIECRNKEKSISNDGMIDREDYTSSRYVSSYIIRCEKCDYKKYIEVNGLKYIGVMDYRHLKCNCA